MQGFELGHGVSPWQGALQGCPQSFRISLQAWLPGIQNKWKKLLNDKISILMHVPYFLK